MRRAPSFMWIATQICLLSRMVAVDCTWRLILGLVHSSLLRLLSVRGCTLYVWSTVVQCLDKCFSKISHSRLLYVILTGRTEWFIIKSTEIILSIWICVLLCNVHKNLLTPSRSWDVVCCVIYGFYRSLFSCTQWKWKVKQEKYSS